jgi:hypothetical protein
LSHPDIEPAIPHELSPVPKITDRTSFSHEPGKVLLRDHTGSRRRDTRIVVPEPPQDLFHLFHDLLHPLLSVTELSDKVAKLFFQDVLIALG